MHLLIFPNQLFAQHPGFELNPRRVVLIEDSLFFGDANYPAKFHQQKLWLHRASMKRFEADLVAEGQQTVYLDHDPSPESLKRQLEKLIKPRTLKPRTCLLYTSPSPRDRG